MDIRSPVMYEVEGRIGVEQVVFDVMPMDGIGGVQYYWTSTFFPNLKMELGPLPCMRSGIGWQLGPKPYRNRLCLRRHA